MMIQLVLVLGSLLLYFAVPWAVARAVAGPALNLVWRLAHGPERSERARDWILWMVPGWTLLCVLALLERAGSSVGLFLLVSLVYSGGVSGLRQALLPLGQDAAPRIPRQRQQEHDGLQVVLTHRSALPMVLLAGSFPLWPVTWLLALLWALLPRRTVVLRLRPETIEVGAGPAKTVLPLHGLRVFREDGLDGTPQICLMQGERMLRVGVGGDDPAEGAWVVAEIRAAVQRAPAPVPEVEPPDAIRQMLARPQRERV